MLNENAKKWVEALRSGKYQQAKYKLNDGDGFCCLGVACELAILNGVKVSEKLQKETGNTAYGTHLDSLPRQVKKWLNLATDEGYTDVHDEPLSTMNDRGATFAEIADIIESEPEGLFAALKQGE